MMPLLCDATTWNSFRKNREGLNALEQKSYLSAYQSFLQGLEDDPLNLPLQMNLGLSFEANEEYEKAARAYQGVAQLAPKDSELQFYALFNEAGMLAKQRKIDEALAVYQAALKIRPDSLEVKRNIELLWKGGDGGGGGEQDPNKKPNDSDQGKGNSPQPEKENQEKKPKPFNSPQLSPQDVKRILDEIKNQEQGIRAQEYDKGAKEAPRAKDW